METNILTYNAEPQELNGTPLDQLENTCTAFEKPKQDVIESAEDNVSSIKDAGNDQKHYLNGNVGDMNKDNDEEVLINEPSQKKHRHKRPVNHKEAEPAPMVFPTNEMEDNFIYQEHDKALPKMSESQFRIVRGKENPRPIDHWESSIYNPADGSDDEFDISTCRFPVYKDDDAEAPFYTLFKNGYPDIHGEVTSCFDEPNLLYRIVNQAENVWAFYNDSLKHEMHVHFTFGKNSKIQPLGKTTLLKNDKKKFECDVVVYPTETELFIKGTLNGFTSSMRAVPLSDEYHKACQRLVNEHIAEEVRKIREVCTSDSVEEVLQACIAYNIPFVDPEFPPCQESLDGNADNPLKPLAWARPSMYLPEEMIHEVRLFRTSVKPGVVLPGELGDSWVMCAVASVSEDPNRLMGMFRHPEGKEQGQKERSVGAYRVTLSKNGWWRSVLIDDYLPVSAGRPKFARSAIDDAEIWPCILQKAFAKLHRGYGAICSGDPLLAIQDMTGLPNTRFDDALSRSGASTIQVFNNVKKALEHGSIVIFNTPGKDPKLDNNIDFTKQYNELGLITGHAYTIIDAIDFPDINAHLVKLRNAWGFGLEWKGDWSDQSTKWDENPSVAEACNFKKLSDGTFWMDWENVLKYFNGGGVCLSQTPCYDYRINCAFFERVPSTVLEIDLKVSTEFLFMILLEDKRGNKEASEYQPVMISIAAPAEDDLYEVILNSTTDVYCPSSEKWIFTQARDVSLIHTLDPGKYIVIPRLMKRDNQPDEVPFILGMISNREVGCDDLTVNFKFIDCDNPVFADFPTFAPDLRDPMVEVQYQRRLPSTGFPDTEMGFCIQ